MAIDPNMIFIDERLRLENCVYCGGEPETRDHIPPKIFLDIPHPEYLPVVPACQNCNNKKSLDEVYLACLLECVICGTTETSKLKREKIQKVLQHSPGLQEKIESGKQVVENEMIWSFEQDRIRSLALRLAQGHIAYEEFAILDEPHHIFVSPLCMVPSDMVYLFSYNSELSEIDTWPEIGSRGFLRSIVVGNKCVTPSWIDIQDGRYRYKIIQSSAVAIVIREYLGIYVSWE